MLLEKLPFVTLNPAVYLQHLYLLGRNNYVIDLQLFVLNKLHDGIPALSREAILTHAFPLGQDVCTIKTQDHNQLSCLEFAQSSLSSGYWLQLQAKTFKEEN